MDDSWAKTRGAKKRLWQMAPVLNEQSLQRYVAMEAQAMGHGGVSAMARVSGLARSTIYRGLADIAAAGSVPVGRVRKPGGGRKRKVVEDPTLLPALKKLAAPSTRGDPEKPLLWTSLSLRSLAGELTRRASRFVPGSWVSFCMGWVTACRRAARPKKAASTSIATRSSTTSMLRPRPTWQRTNRSSRSIRKRKVCC